MAPTLPPPPHTHSKVLGDAAACVHDVLNLSYRVQTSEHNLNPTGNVVCVRGILTSLDTGNLNVRVPERGVLPVDPRTNK